MKLPVTDQQAGLIAMVLIVSISMVAPEKAHDILLTGISGVIGWMSKGKGEHQGKEG